MKLIDTLNRFVGKYMALIVLALSALSLFFPPAALWSEQTGSTGS